MENITIDGGPSSHSEIYCWFPIMSFHVEGHIICLLGYAALGKCIWEHDGGAMSGAPVPPEWVAGMSSGVTQLTAQARHNWAFSILQRERPHASLHLNSEGGVSDSLLHEDFLQLHLYITCRWSCSSSPQLLRQVELGLSIPCQYGLRFIIHGSKGLECLFKTLRYFLIHGNVLIIY